MKLMKLQLLQYPNKFCKENFHLPNLQFLQMRILENKIPQTRRMLSSDDDDTSYQVDIIIIADSADDANSVKNMTNIEPKKINFDI